MWIMKKSNKKLTPKHIRNKHAKEIRKMLKNKKQKVTAKAIHNT
jgi:hypothetical protein